MALDFIISSLSCCLIISVQVSGIKNCLELVEKQGYSPAMPTAVVSVSCGEAELYGMGELKELGELREVEV